MLSAEKKRDSEGSGSLKIAHEEKNRFASKNNKAKSECTLILRAPRTLLSAACGEPSAPRRARVSESCPQCVVFAHTEPHPVYSKEEEEHYLLFLALPATQEEGGRYAVS